MGYRVMTSEEVEREFGIKAEDIEKWEADASRGILPGVPSGPVVYGPGRPMMFGERTRQVGFKEPDSKVEAIDRRARQLGMRRSDYLRLLVDRDLEEAGVLEA